MAKEEKNNNKLETEFKVTVSMKEALENFDSLLTNISIEHYRQHKRGKNKEVISKELVNQIPTFEKCLYVCCKCVGKCYDVKTHKQIHNKQKCDKLIPNYTLTLDKENKLESELSQRELTIIYSLIVDVLGNHQQIDKDTRLDYLAEKVKLMASRKGGVKVTSQ